MGIQMKQMIMMKRARTRTTRSKQSSAMKSNLSETSQGDNLRGNLRTNIQNSVEKFTNLAREALLIGDRVQAESYFQQAEHYLRLNNEYKENILVMPRSETPAPSQEVLIPANDFEMSIEQELAIAQQKNS
jgi:hypothetical protein